MSADSATATNPTPRVERRPIWIRGGFMLLFLVAFSLAQTLQAAIAVLQFGTLIVTGRPNAYLAQFGRGLALWLAEASAFLTCASERRPFPFSPWPKID